MKKIILIIALFVLSDLMFSQTDEVDDYTLTIKNGIVEKLDKKTYWVIPTALKNNSKDTLKYFSISCSWLIFYSVDNKKLQIEPHFCDNNNPIIKTLAPGETRTAQIRLLVNQSLDSSEIKFRIGFNLCKVSNNQDAFDFNFREEREKNNVIWSNLISM